MAVQQTAETIERLTFLTAWILVMLVTFVEAYVEDVLILSVNLNPDWLHKSTARIDYSDLLKANSVDTLIHEIQVRWAKNILQSGGPDNWIGRLEGFGAKGYRPNLESEMRVIWEKRHSIVHKPTKNFHVSFEELDSALSVVQHFVLITEKFIVGLESSRKK